jgi:hypothetical protein
MDSNLAIAEHTRKEAGSATAGKVSYYLKPGFFFLVFATISLLSLVAQNFPPPKDMIDGLLIPDVLNLSNLIDVVTSGDYDVSYILANFSSPGVVFLYRVAWLVHPMLSFCINMALIYLCIRITHYIFTKISRVGSLACIGVISNPYLYLAVTGPNKEIPMLCTTLLIFYLLVFKPRFWFASSLLIAVVTYFIRDGYGVILAITILLFSVFKKLPRHFLLVGLLFCSAAAGSFWYLGNYFEFIARNKALFEYTTETGEKVGSSILGFSLLGSPNPIVEAIVFHIKAVYNLVGLAIYPQFVSVNGGWYILGLAFWVFSILIIAGMISCVWMVLREYRYTTNSATRVKISVLVIFVWWAVSLSAFTQPRYLMPLLPLAFGIYITSDSSKISKIRLLFSIVCFVLLIISFYYFTEHSPPPSGVIDARPSFLWSEESF